MKVVAASVCIFCKPKVYHENRFKICIESFNGMAWIQIQITSEQQDLQQQRKDTKLKINMEVLLVHMQKQ